MSVELEIVFSNLAVDGYVMSSPKTQSYNCVAWAAGDKTRIWWPEPAPEYYWPEGAVRIPSKEGFVSAFALFGYAECGLLEHPNPAEYEVIAFYQKGDEVRHVALQLVGGEWSSKMGPAMDMSHELSELYSPGYGGLGWKMKRKRS